MKRFILTLGVILLTACSSTPTGGVSEDPSDGLAKTGSAESTASQRYVFFTVNTQEFVYEEQSVETLSRILDIHEKYEVPVDVYLTDDILRVYAEIAPELVERFKTSPMVAVSYHERPPRPYHSSAYDFLGLDELSQEELTATLLDYEEHAVDPVTGKTTDEAGGYQYVKDVIGYAPLVVGMASERKSADALGEIFKEKGASFVVAHGDTYDLGETRYGLFLRPEDIEVILPEYLGQDPTEFIPTLWEGRDSGFMNIKVHDNDFIASDSAWVAIYLKQKPPYRLDRGTTNRSLLSEEESDAWWEIYEKSVQYVSENASQYQALNAFDLQKMLP